jgi:F0F1-type ATP synthase assembly protein I
LYKLDDGGGRHAPTCALGVVVGSHEGRYTVPHISPGKRGNGKGKRGSPASGEAIAFLVLAGVVLGTGAGAGLDFVIKTFPLCTVIGVFVGFALALYAVYVETK